MEEIYTFRHAQKSGQKAQMSLADAVIEQLSGKLKVKAKVD